MPALMDRQRFQIHRDGARLGLVCGEIENQFRSALEQAALSIVNALHVGLLQNGTNSVTERSGWRELLPEHLVR